MKQSYAYLINDLLGQYHSKLSNINSAVAVANEVRQISKNDYAFRLSVGMEGLLSVARAAGDVDSADALEAVISQCNFGNVPLTVAI